MQTDKDVMQLMAEGNQNRTVGSTSMNAQSSRSHSILELSVHVHGHSNVMGVQLRGTLHLTDLAGSERVGRSMANATGERLEEAQAICINLSLSALGNVIEALQKNSKQARFEQLVRSRCSCHLAAASAECAASALTSADHAYIWASCSSSSQPMANRE